MVVVAPDLLPNSTVYEGGGYPHQEQEHPVRFLEHPMPIIYVFLALLLTNCILDSPSSEPMPPACGNPQACG